MRNLIFLKSRKLGNLRAVYLLKNGFENLLQGKASQPPRYIRTLKKNIIENQWFNFQKFEKQKKSKNGDKRPLGAFNQEMWAIKFFHKIGKKTKH